MGSGVDVFYAGCVEQKSFRIEARNEHTLADAYRQACVQWCTFREQ